MLQIMLLKKINYHTNTTVCSYFAFPKYTYQFIQNIKQILLALAQFADSRHRAHLRSIVYF